MSTRVTNQWLVFAGIVCAAAFVGGWLGVAGFIFALLILCIVWVLFDPSGATW